MNETQRKIVPLVDVIKAIPKSLQNSLILLTVMKTKVSGRDIFSGDNKYPICFFTHPVNQIWSLFVRGAKKKESLLCLFNVKYMPFPSILLVVVAPIFFAIENREYIGWSYEFLLSEPLFPQVKISSKTTYIY